MGYLVFFLLYLGMLILTFIFSFHSCKKYYFLLDTLVIGVLLVIGTIYSWGWNAYRSIAGYTLFYMLCRFPVLLIIFIIRRKTRIIFQSRKDMERFLVWFNIIINTIIFFPAIYMNISVGGA
jgi:hypothetical protein